MNCYFLLLTFTSKYWGHNVVGLEKGQVFRSTTSKVGNFKSTSKVGKVAWLASTLEVFCFYF